MLPALYQQFLSNMVHAKLTDIVIPVRMTSLKAAQALSDKIGQIDLVYIDASHDTYSVVLDLHTYLPFVQSSGGILCGDDWWFEDVKLAVKIFAKKHCLTIYSIPQ